MDKADRLILVKNCPECSLVRAELKPDIIESDKFLGKDGQKFFVFSALTDDAGRDLLDKFGMTGKFAPVLICHDGQVIDKPMNIVSYMRTHGMT